MKFFFVLTILCLMAQIDTWAQATSNFQIWNDFNPSFNLSEKWKIGGDVGYRIEPSTNFQSAYIRPAIQYNPNEIINFKIGIANFNSWEPQEFTKSEIRTFQFIGVLAKSGQLSI